jgi:hypothetical protein
MPAVESPVSQCVMKDRSEESVLSNRLSGLLEILGRDKVSSFLSDHQTGKNSRTAIRRRRLRVGRSHWGQWLYTVRRRRLCVGTYFPSETLEQSLFRSKSKELVAPVIWMK